MQLKSNKDYQPGFEMITFVIGIGICIFSVILFLVILWSMITDTFPLVDGSEFGLMIILFVGIIFLIPLAVGLIMAMISSLIIKKEKDEFIIQKILVFLTK